MFRFIVDMIFPQKCILCGKIINHGGEGYFCIDCEPWLPLIGEARCDKCGRPALNAALCPECRQREYAFVKNRAVVAYDKDMRKMILRFKYGRRMEYGPGLGGLMALAYPGYFGETGDIVEKFDYVMPIPLHRKRYAKRGFNQAALLAVEVAKAAGAPLVKNALIRVRNTKPQSSLDPEQRIENVKNAFAFRNVVNINGKIILLVDDIFTTGCTMSVCAGVLTNCGAAKVYGFTLAATERY